MTPDKNAYSERYYAGFVRREKELLDRMQKYLERDDSEVLGDHNSIEENKKKRQEVWKAYTALSRRYDKDRLNVDKAVVDEYNYDDFDRGAKGSEIIKEAETASDRLRRSESDKLLKEAKKLEDELRAFERMSSSEREEWIRKKRSEQKKSFEDEEAARKIEEELANLEEQQRLLEEQQRQEEEMKMLYQLQQLEEERRRREEEERKRQEEEERRRREEEEKEKREKRDKAKKAVGKIIVIGAAIAALRSALSKEEEFRNEKVADMKTEPEGSEKHKKAFSEIMGSVYRTMYLDVLEKTYGNNENTPGDVAEKNEKNLSNALKKGFRNKENTDVFQHLIEGRFGEAIKSGVRLAVTTGVLLTGAVIFKIRDEVLKHSYEEARKKYEESKDDKDAAECDRIVKLSKALASNALEGINPILTGAKAVKDIIGRGDEVMAHKPDKTPVAPRM